MENSQDWKSALDPTSGRTYWYHRKTRVSTWTKPDFLDPPPGVPKKDTHQSDPMNHATHTHQGRLLEREREVTNIKSIATVSSASSGDLRNDIATGFVRFLATNNNSTNLENLNSLMLKFMNPRVQCMINESPVLLTDLSNFVSNTEASSARLLALQALFKLSSIRSLCSSAFVSNQSWTNIFPVVDFLNESFVLLISALACNLLVGPSAACIPSSGVDLLVDFLLQSIRSLFTENNSARPAIRPTAWQEWKSIVTDISLWLFALIANKGHALPALLLLRIAMISLRSVIGEGFVSIFAFTETFLKQ